ncbi:MAG: peptidoglycan glycosyltransferase [Lachnospiraceae bacterium]|nr:peptidoglycan glycosyltransferase [Lachnospiraceae bacterium]
MIEFLRDFFSNFFASRLRVLTALLVFFSCVLVLRLFILQIVRGADYQANYNLRIEKTESIDATRGNIYDRNGELLAYNKLAYAVTIEDSGSYPNRATKNELLNEELSKLISRIEANGDSLNVSFGIVRNSAGGYEFTSSGTSLMRFRADVFGYANIKDMKFNDIIDKNEADATADDVMKYLCSEKRYGVSDKYSEDMRFKIVMIRYNMGLNSYQKYIATTIATDVSLSTVAYVMENENELVGVSVEEKTMRVYEDPEAFSSLIGYTGKISTDEYNELSEKGENVSLNDIVGKAGIEKSMNEYLSGTKGSQTVYVDSIGNLIETTDYEEPVAGGHVYMSIDKKLQSSAYRILEQEIAGIVYSKIQNIKEYKVSDDEKDPDIIIPIYDVYFALINNGLIDTSHFEAADASAMEKQVLSNYKAKKKQVYADLNSYLRSSNSIPYESLDEEYQTYMTFIVKKLKADGVLDSNLIDNTDDMQVRWTNEELSVNDYLSYCIERNWIDITRFAKSSKYVDTNEIYSALVDYILASLEEDAAFQKQMYYYAILSDQITGAQLCVLLFDQGVLEMDEEAYATLSAGNNAYNFLRDKIQNLEITPAQLALDPCTGSSVVIDSTTGAVLACVSYPGYDNNRLAASDSAYYAYLNSNLSNPLYNYATQQRTAPGSTFKPVSATAALSEGIIDTSTEILDEGVFTKVSNQPKCWAYPSNHGSINVSEAIRDSCNYFFYEVGWELAGGNDYEDAKGMEYLQSYAKLFGLNAKTGIEIEEATPKIATEYPVMAAIGQSDNNFTTIALARYAAAVANSGTVYDLTLLDHVTDANGDTIASYNSTVKNHVDVLNYSEWNAIHSGMRMVVENLSYYDNFEIVVAGKTGTAQQARTRPNHALFIGYAPYDNPQIAVASRIAFGYTSGHAANVSRDIIGVYFGAQSSLDVLNGQANAVSTSNVTRD